MSDRAAIRFMAVCGVIDLAINLYQIITKALT